MISALGWAAWHAARFHRLSFGRPYDAPVGWQFHCRCGDRSHRM